MNTNSGMARRPPTVSAAHLADQLAKGEIGPQEFLDAVRELEESMPPSWTGGVTFS